MTRRTGLAQMVNKYDESHRNPMNRLCHYVGIPSLTIAILGLLSKVRWGWNEEWSLFNLGFGLLICALAWQLWKGITQNLPVFVSVVVYALTCLSIGSLLSVPVLIGTFIVGASSHFLGHYLFEHKPPSFLSDPRSILVSPVWLSERFDATLEWLNSEESWPPHIERISPKKIGAGNRKTTERRPRLLDFENQRHAENAGNWTIGSNASHSSGSTPILER